MVAGIIPFGGFIIGGPIAGGMYLIFLRRLRGEPAEISQLFAGFKGDFWPLFLTYLFLTIALGLLSLVLLIPITLIIVFGVLYISGDGGGNPAEMENLIYLIVLFSGLAMLPLILIAMTLGGMLGLSIPLVMDRKMDPLEAFKGTWKITRQCWKKFLGLSFCFIAINLAGVLLCCLGWLIAVPLMIATNAVVYEQLLGHRIKS